MQVDRRTPEEELPQYLSPREIQLFTGMGRATVYDLIRRGEWKSVRFGRTIRVPKSEIVGK